MKHRAIHGKNEGEQVGGIIQIHDNLQNIHKKIGEISIDVVDVGVDECQKMED